MKMELPAAVENIIQTLEEHGHEAYAVGGCVRDSILGKEPKDWDITTSALPEEVKEVFGHTIDTGIQHGTVTVMMDHEGYEVTTYRVDGEYKDGRHPEQVTFTPSLLEDLKRRDFTINAMAYNPTRGLVDEFDGQGDLKRHIIRAVGEPEKRFTEDALRMMRAIRFAARLDFDIEKDTYEAISKLAPTLSKVSAERIRDEFEKTICSDHPEHIRKLYETGLLDIFLPEWRAMEETPQHTIHHKYNVADHTVEVMRHTPANRILRLAALLHDVAKPACRTTDEKNVDHFKGHPEKGAEMAGVILKRMRYDNDTIQKVKVLVRYHDERPSDTERSVRRAVAKIGPKACPDLFLLKRGDMLGQSDYHRAEKLNQIDYFERRYYEIMEKKEALCIKDLAIGGRELMELGLPKGPALGQVLGILLDNVLDDPNLNDRETLIDLTEHLLKTMDLKTKDPKSDLKTVDSKSLSADEEKEGTK